MAWYDNLISGYADPFAYGDFFRRGSWPYGPWGRVGFAAGNLALYGGGAYAIWGASQIMNPTETGSRLTGVQALAVGASVASSPFWIEPATARLSRWWGGIGGMKGVWSHLGAWWRG